MPLNACRKIGCCRTNRLIIAVLGALLAMAGCSRPTPDLPGESATPSSATPFRDQAASDLQTTSKASSAGDQDTNLPFQDSDAVPAGTLLTVRLKAPLDAVSGSKAVFQALLDEPLTVAGSALIPRDAVFTGEMESLQVSKSRPDRSYLRLTLTSVQVEGVSVPVQSASLYVRRHPTDVAAASVSVPILLEKGRRLTFRLKEQLFLHPNLSKSSQ